MEEKKKPRTCRDEEERKKDVSLSWIKIDTDIFNNEKLLLIESMPNSTEIMLVWFKLLCHAGKSNESGRFTIGARPYTADFFARIFRCRIEIVEEALDIFEDLGMIVRDDDGTVSIKNWRKHQSIDQADLIRTQTKARVAKYREKQKNVAEKQLVELDKNDDVTQCNAECNAESNADCNGDCNAIEENRIEENRIEESRIEESTYVNAEPQDCAPPPDVPPLSYCYEIEDEEEIAKPIPGNGRDVVYLTDTQAADLVARLGEELYQAYLDRLSSFIIEKRARVKYHYETIIRWYEEDRRACTLPITDSIRKEKEREYAAMRESRTDASYKSRSTDEKPRYGSFDPNEAFQVALRRSMADSYELGS